MKRMIAALLAAVLLLALTACGQETPAEEVPEAPPSEPVVQPPETEEPPQIQPPAVEEAPPVEAPPAEDAPVADAGDATVTISTEMDSIEELVTYELKLPVVETGDAAVDQILSDYYTSVGGKLRDLCWGEVYEQALEDRAVIHVTADFTVKKNSEGILSICRTVTVANLQLSSWPETTTYTETFNLANGGLMTAADFFDADEAAYTARLTEGVHRQISQDPYHDQTYFAQWEDLTNQAFDKDLFYVTDEAYCVVYQQFALGGAAENVFPIPWSSLADIRK